MGLNGVGLKGGVGPKGGWGKGVGPKGVGFNGGGTLGDDGAYWVGGLGRSSVGGSVSGWGYWALSLVGGACGPDAKPIGWGVTGEAGLRGKSLLGGLLEKQGRGRALWVGVAAADPAPFPGRWGRCCRSWAPPSRSRWPAATLGC